jgi:hypothetical protein
MLRLFLSISAASSLRWSDGEVGLARLALNDLPNSPYGMPDGGAASVAACAALCAAQPSCVAWSMRTCEPALPKTPSYACSVKWGAGVATQDPSNCTTSGLSARQLMPPAHLAVPSGSLRPAGWLGAQLQLEADGLTGHLADFYPDVMNSSWVGGPKDGSPQERAPYWLRGAVPLAHALGDARLQASVGSYVDYALTHADPSGWLGPPANGDRQYWGR